MRKTKRGSKRKSKRGVRRGARASCPVPVRTRRVADGPWIQREGLLGGPGYAHKSDRERHRLLRCALERVGYKSVLGAIQAPIRRRKGVSSEVRSVFKADLEWLKEHHS